MLDGGEADDKIIAVLENDNVWGERARPRRPARDPGRAPAPLLPDLQDDPRGEPAAVTVATTYGREHALAVVQAAMDDYDEIYG